MILVFSTYHAVQMKPFTKHFVHVLGSKITVLGQKWPFSSQFRKLYSKQDTQRMILFDSVQMNQFTKYFFLSCFRVKNDRFWVNNCLDVRALLAPLSRSCGWLWGGLRLLRLLFFSTFSSFLSFITFFTFATFSTFATFATVSTFFFCVSQHTFLGLSPVTCVTCNFIVVDKLQSGCTASFSSNF